MQMFQFTQPQQWIQIKSNQIKSKRNWSAHSLSDSRARARKTKSKPNSTLDENGVYVHTGHMRPHLPRDFI